MCNQYRQKVASMHAVLSVERTAGTSVPHIFFFFFSKQKLLIPQHLSSGTTDSTNAASNYSTAGIYVNSIIFSVLALQEVPLFALWPLPTRWKNDCLWGTNFKYQSNGCCLASGCRYKTCSFIDIVFTGITRHPGQNEIGNPDKSNIPISG